MTRPHLNAREADARRALVLVDRPLATDLIQLTLNHGLFVVRAARNLAEAVAILDVWPPHMAVIDMDHDDSSDLLLRLHASNSLTRSDTPILGLTRRGDLPTKLKAFELGVDDILAMPFSPEELLARLIVITRRMSGIHPPIVPTIKLGGMVIDIVSREVRDGDSIVHLSGIEQSLLYLLASRGGLGRVERRDPRRGVGHRFHREEQHCLSAYSRSAGQVAGRLPPPALHRHAGVSETPEDALEVRQGGVRLLLVQPLETSVLAIWPRMPRASLSRSISTRGPSSSHVTSDPSV